MNKKTALVTGGAGFIGAHLSEELIRFGYHVIILDNLSTGNMSNINHLSRQGNIEFIEGSIMDPPLLQKLSRNVDYVFHQAAIPSVPRSLENPKASHQTNITGTLNVLLAAKDEGVKKVIYASSSSVYGDTPTLPKSEDMQPKPKSPYAVTKLASEYYCVVFGQLYDFSTVCLRYFNVYGSRQSTGSQYSSVIPAFIDQVSKGNPPVIFGDGEQTRDFTFVKDTVKANILAAESNAEGIFNVATANSISINSLADLIIRLMGKNMEPIHQENRSGDVRHSLADISRFEVYGYKPQWRIEEGLRETIRNYQYAI